MLNAIGITSPNAGQKICLQLQPDRQPIVFSFTNPASSRLHAIGNAGQILHVMSNFVRDDVRLREIATCAEALLEFTEKAEVDVNASILRTIERTGGPTGEAATGLNHICEEHELRFFVLAAHLLKHRIPGVFGISENDSNEF